MKDAVLQARGISKTFFATAALVDINLTLNAGDIHGLVGENGSGKSTLVKILAGVYQADEGTIEGPAGGTLDASNMTPSDSRDLGIHVVHQDFPIFGAASVAENLFLGRDFPTHAFARIDRKEIRRRAEWVLERFSVPARPDQKCDELDPAVRAMLAIARALQDCENTSDGVLILDEPTAALTQSEVETLLAAVRQYARDGQAILLVTHRLDEILDTCDVVTALRDGQLVATRPRAELDRGDLIEMIIGREFTPHVPEPDRELADDVDTDIPVLEMRNVTSDRVSDITLTVRPGEIVGVAGLVGSGRTELLEAVFGQRPRTAGTIDVLGEPLEGGPAEAMRRGVAMIPEDRGQDAAFGLLTVRENLSVSVLDSFWGGGRMKRRPERDEAAELISKFDISPPDPKATMSNLSGGNQQKVVLARWLRREPKLLLLDEPTQGVDIGAREQIHDVIRGAAKTGTGVLLVSSDVEELVELADRVLVLIEVRIASEARGVHVARDRLIGMVHAETPTSVLIQEGGAA
jgi:ribose transport system ATP-binding protein